MKREELLASLDVGASIKKLRERKGISQEELAKGICDRTNLSKFEKGYYKSPSLSFLLLICDKLDISLDEFINYAMSNTYKLDRNYLLLHCLSKESQYVKLYLDTINHEMLSRLDKELYALYHCLLSKEESTLLDMKQLTQSKNSTIRLVAYYFCNKSQFISRINQIDFSNLDAEILIVFDDIIHSNANNDTKRVVLKEEITLINLNNSYRFLPTYFKHKSAYEINAHNR